MLESAETFLEPYPDEQESLMSKASRKSLRHFPRQITVLLPESSWYRTSKWPQRHGVENHANALKCTELRLSAD